MSPAAWARGDGIVLRLATKSDLASVEVQQALRDGVERGYTGELAVPPQEAVWYAIEAEHALIGATCIEVGVPASGAATVHELAIVPGQRGHAYGSRALLAAETRLEREGVHDWYARVPRTNGHGMYFMLRCGYAPIRPLADDGVTWFRRNPALAAKKPRGTARPTERASNGAIR